jgi:glycerophosphoryl diester phosphodiesterase
VRYWLAVGTMYVVVALVVTPAARWILDAALDRAGLDSITDRTLGALLASPEAVALIIVDVAMVLAVTTTSFTLMLVIADLQLAGIPPRVTTVVNRTAASLRSLARIELLLVVVQLAVLSPLGGFGLFSQTTERLALPPFIGREFMKTALGASFWAAVTGVIIYVNFRSLLTVPFSVVRQQRPARSFVDSLVATRPNHFRFAAVLTVACVGAALLSRGAALIGGRAIDLLAPYVTHEWVLEWTGVGVLSALSVATAQGFSFMLVRHARDVAGMPSVRQPTSSSRLHASRVRRLTLRASVLGLAAVVSLAGMPIPEPVEAEALPAASTHALVIGHRGYDSGGVENTIGALEAAAPFHPDYVEVDVQQTGDGGFVASHDSNLLVLAGLDKNIYEMTTEEVTQTTVSMRGNSDTIPTMREFVTRARELGLPLLIEPKVTGHETADFVADMLAELQSVDNLEGTLFHSLDPAVVRQISEQKPDLRVGLTIGMLYGSLPDGPADFYTVEQASVTPELIAEAHARGAEIYAWTVNDDLTMRSLLREGIDGLVTDRPDAAATYRDRIARGSEYQPGDARDQLMVEAILP